MYPYLCAPADRESMAHPQGHRLESHTKSDGGRGHLESIASPPYPIYARGLDKDALLNLFFTPKNSTVRAGPGVRKGGSQMTR